MSGYLPAAWSDFALAVVGASAALTGLLFVAVSINIERILGDATLATRTLHALLLFVVPLVVGILVLIPGQPRTAAGVEIAVTGVLAGAGLLRLNRPAARGRLEPPASWLLVRLGPTAVVPLLLLLAGAYLIAGVGGGLYWIAPAVLAAFLGALVTVWVLLVEIRR